MMVISVPDRLHQRVAHGGDISPRQTVSEGGS